MQLVHEDDRVIAVAKPSGQLVVPGRGVPGETLRAEVERHVGRPVLVVHRIDREASGLVLFAKDADGHRELSRQFEGRTVKKGYLAVVQGRVAQDGRVEEPLHEFGSGRIGVSSAGKPSSTGYWVKLQFPRATLLRVEPATGRRHQIRVHLYHLGHPILGDPLYGKERPVGGAPRLMLHAHDVAFKHPSGGPLQLSVEPGDDFLDVLKSLEKQPAP